MKGGILQCQYPPASAGGFLCMSISRRIFQVAFQIRGSCPALPASLVTKVCIRVQRTDSVPGILSRVAGQKLPGHFKPMEKQWRLVEHHPLGVFTYFGVLDDLLEG